MNDRFYLFKLIGVLLLVLVIYFGLNYSGFCFAKMRYISTEEKIRWFFNDLNNARNLLIITPDKDFKDVEFIKHESFDEYIKKNPNCCQFYASGGSPELPPPTFLQRIFGYHTGTFVRIFFEVRYFDDSGKRKSQIIKAERALRNCGEAVTY